MTNLNIEVIKTIYNPLLWTVPVIREELNDYIILREQRIPKKIAYESKELFISEVKKQNKTD